MNDTHRKNDSALFRASVENMLEAFGIYSAVRDEHGEIVDFRIDYVNDAACRINRMSKGQQIGKRLCEVFPGHVDSGLLDHYRRVVETRRPMEIEIDSYGDDKHRHLNHRVFEIKAASFNDGIVVSWRDITRQRETEVLLNQTIKQYQAVVEDQTEVITRFNPDGTLIFVNEACCRFFGFDRDRVIGKKWKTVAYENDLPVINSKLETLTPSHPIVVIENRVWTADGQVRWMQFVNRGFFNEDGRMIEIQCVGRDITDLKEKERLVTEKEKQIRQYAEKMEKVNAALEVLLERRNHQLERFKETAFQNFSRTILPGLEQLKKRLKKEINQKAVTHIIKAMDLVLSPNSLHITSAQYGLTRTEIKVAVMIRNGMTSADIAEQMNVSPNTVGFHRKNLRKKFGLKQSGTSLDQFLKQQVSLNEHENVS